MNFGSRATGIGLAMMVGLFTASCGQGPVQLSNNHSVISSPSATAADSHIVEFLQVQRASWEAPAISATVSVKGEIVFSGAVGLARTVDTTAATATTIYRASSISKTMTTVAILQLVDQGKLTLDDEVQTWVPEFPEKSWPVTIRQLLAHTSGIRRWNETETQRALDPVTSFVDAIEGFKYDDLRFEPGTQFAFTNLGYTLLQGVVERASGMAFREYMSEFVWTPAGMIDTDLEVRGDSDPRRAMGYRKEASVRITEAPYIDVAIIYAGAGMLTTTEDLTRFCFALGNETLISDSLVDFMFRELEIRPGTGTPWRSAIEEDSGLRRTWHAGGLTGFQSYVLYYPEPQVTVAILTNQEYTSPFVQLAGVAQVLANLYLHCDDEEKSSFSLSPLRAAVGEALDAEGFDAALDVCRQFTSSRAWKDWNVELDLNWTGYEYMQRGHYDRALEMFKLNVALYPNSWNVYDSLGELYLKSGRRDLARLNYERSLELNPDNANGAAALERLGST